MQYYNNILCITYGELVNRSAAPNVVGENAFLSKYDYLNLSSAKKLKVVRRGCKGTEAMYEFESLPMAVKTEISKKTKDIVKKAQQEPVKKLLVNDYAAINFFSTYTLPNGEHLKANTQREYASTAVALNAVIKLLDDGKAWRKALGGTSKGKGSLAMLIDVLDSLKDQWGWKLPNSERGLRGKISAYRNDKYASLISGKLCNDNAAKVVESEQEAALRRILAQGRNFDNIKVMNIYNIVADAAGWKRITKQTVANKRDEWQIYTDAGSRGLSHHNDNHAMQHTRRAAVSPTLYWTLDGWDVELLYQETATDAKGYINTTYHNRLTVVVVLDPCQKYPIGYAIGTHESPDLIRQAIRNAVKHTAELFGEMHHPHQLQTDNYSSKNLTPFYQGLANYYTPARVKNAKAKVIEPYFKHLNTSYCQLQHNWSGYGVTSRKENQPNAEIINKIRKSFPDRAGCVSQIIDMMESERLRKREAYLAAWELLPTEKRLSWTREQFLFTLGETNKRNDSVRLQGNGVNLQYNNQKYLYESFEPAFRQHRNTDWYLKFDPEDMKSCLAVNEDASLRFMLGDKYVQPMALVERTDGDSRELLRVEQFNKDLKQDILNVQAHDYHLLEGLMHQNPVIEETLGKLLIIDSGGQHKNNKSVARLNQQQKVIEIKEARRIEKEERKSKAELLKDYIDNKTDFTDYL